MSDKFVENFADLFVADFFCKLQGISCTVGYVLLIKPRFVVKFFSQKIGEIWLNSSSQELYVPHCNRQRKQKIRFVDF